MVTATAKRNQISVDRGPQTDDELWWFVYATWGVRIPRTVVCHGHTAPFEAFANAYFARESVAIWKASRGFGGKTNTLSILGMTELVALGAHVTILGGSGEQSQRVHETMKSAWNFDASPSHLLMREPTKYNTDLTNGAHARTLMASQKSVRGPHPQRMRLDEIDEMELEVLEAAQGQPMRKKNKNGEWVDTNTVMCVVGSTRVLTSRGEIPIVEVTEDDFVMTRIGWQPVKQITNSGRKEVVEVHLSNGRTLVCTDDHRIAVPGGWMIPRVMSAGQEVLGISSDIGARDSSLDGSSVSGLPSSVAESVVDSFAGSTFPPSTLGKVGVGLSVRVPVGAMSLLGVGGRRGDTPEDIHFAGDNFRVSRIDAGSIPTQVVELETIGDRSNEAFVSPHMDRTTVDGAVHPSVSPGLRAVPYPAVRNNDIPTALENGSSFSTPRQEPVFVVDIVARSGRHDVYDLSVDGVEEFTAEGIIIHNSSTQQYPDGTMKKMMDRAKKQGWRIYEWCFRESSNPVDGWLSPDEIERKRNEVTQRMWEAEYELQEPSFEGRAIDEASVERMFDPFLGTAKGGVAKYIEVEPPRRDADYITGVDWAKAKDFTVIWTYDTTTEPWRTVAFERINRRPWPMMIDRLNKRLDRYGGSVAYDATGIGSVVEDYIEIPRHVREENVVGRMMAGRDRNDMLNNYISGIEQGLLVCPRIEYPYEEHKYATPDDLFGTSSSNHVPDSIAAGALAWSLRKKGKRIAVPVISINRESPWIGRP